MTTKPKPLTRAQRRARKPGETTGRKPLPPEKRRVQRTVSLDRHADEWMKKLAKESGRTVSRQIEDIVTLRILEIQH